MNSFFLKIEGKFVKILFSEILYIEAYKNYVRIQTAKALFTAHYTLKQIEENIPSELFIRVHKSYIVAIEKISSFYGTVVSINQKELPVSPQFAKALKSKLNILHSEHKAKLKVNRDGDLISDDLNPDS